MLLDGTDGLQFSPNLQDGNLLKSFVHSLNRNIDFEYSHTDDDFYDHIDTHMFYMQDSMMLNYTANADNENYEITIDGTTNLSSSLKSYAFAMKGHYYGLSPKAADSVPTIRNSTTGEKIDTAT